MPDQEPVASYRLTIQLKQYYKHEAHIILADGADFNASNKVANIIYRLIMTRLCTILAKLWHFGPEPTEDELANPPKQSDNILLVDL